MSRQWYVVNAYTLDTVAGFSTYAKANAYADETDLPVYIVSDAEIREQHILETITELTQLRNQ
jgi:hypothetical protein